MEPTPKMYDMYIASKNMHPFWIFSDFFHGKYTGGKYLCFIGANYEVGLVSQHEDAHERAVARLKNGLWKLEQKKYYADMQQPDKKIGWGAGDTPTDAFQAALQSSSYVKVEDTTKSKS